MEVLTDWSAVLGSAFTQFAARAGQYLPSLLGAFVLLLVGWFVARVMRSLAVRDASSISSMRSRR